MLSPVFILAELLRLNGGLPILRPSVHLSCKKKKVIVKTETGPLGAGHHLLGKYTD